MILSPKLISAPKSFRIWSNYQFHTLVHVESILYFDKIQDLLIDDHVFYR
jgi:hypothetical protein